MKLQTALAIETEGLVKRFGEKTAVDGIDLAVPAGSAALVAVFAPLTMRLYNKER